MKITLFKPKPFPEHANLTCLKTIKFGIDPTFNRLHIGHLVILSWLARQKKKDITIVLGTKTAQLGDPTGKEKTRPFLSEEEVLHNAHQLKKVVKTIVPHARIIFQEDITAMYLLRLSSHFTITKLMSRHGFDRRESVSLHEFSVPILQALDSVFLCSEFEVGGEDQLFNFEMTREVQKNCGQKPQSCGLFPILIGLDGQKMSKSVGNCLWLDDPMIYSKIMSVSDEVMDQWLPLFSRYPIVPDHPKVRKEFLANQIVSYLS